MTIGNANVIKSISVVQSNTCTTISASNNNTELGRLVDDGSLYSAIGEMKLWVLFNQSPGKLKIDNMSSEALIFSIGTTEKVCTPVMHG